MKQLLISSPIASININGIDSVQLGAHSTDQSDGSIFKKLKAHQLNDNTTLSKRIFLGH
jgi:hypothetical protein